MKRLLKIVLTLGLIVSTLFSSNVYAMPTVKTPEMPKNLSVSKTANNNYSIQIGNDSISLGNGATTSFTPMMVFPHWQGYAWNTSIGLSMAVPANALAAADMTSSNTATSVTASNSYFSITYGGVPTKEGFNETGGVDINITLKRSIGNTLAFSFNNVNTKAFLQPSLTLEWSIGQDLGNGVTVASVTDTDVTGTDGLVHVHRPDYVVNAIAFYHATQGGLVSDVQAATGLTTGQIGMLYRMKVTDSSPTPKVGWANWSIQNANTLWLNLDTTGMVYPIQITPAGDTFGYTATSSTYIIAGNNAVAFYTVGVTGAAGTGTSITSYCRVFSGTSYMKMALYTLSGSTYSLLTAGGTDATSAVPTGTPAARTGNFTSSPTLTATTYFFVMNFSAGTGYIYYNSGGGGALYYSKAMTYGTWNTFTATGSISAGSIPCVYCTYTAGGGSTYNLTNSPSSIDFGVIQPSTKYYAYGSAPSNPVTDAQCTFTITNGQANIIKVNIQATDFTGGGGWTLGTPDGTHARLIAYTSGSNPASGVTLTTSPQVFVASLAASATLKWDFSWETATSFADGTQKSSSITLTGLAP